MSSYTEIAPNHQPDELAAIRSEVRELFLLNYELGQRIDAALPKTGPTPAAKGNGIDIASIPLNQLVATILDQRGERGAAWLRTRLHQRLEQRRGRRLPGGGSDRITTVVED